MSIHINHRRAIFAVGVILLILFLSISSLMLPVNVDSNKPIQSEPPSIQAYQPTVEPQKVDAPNEPIPAQAIIRFDKNTTEQERAAYIQSVGGTVVKQIDSLDTVVVSVSENVAQVPLPESPVVAGTEPDYYASALGDLIPNDPRYIEQWALPAIGAPSAWEQLPANAPKVIVAVIDSGICDSHPDLAGRIINGWDFLENDAVPQDDFGHGCAVSGVIAANMNDGIGIAGIAPNAQIMPLRVLNASGVGSYSDVAAAIVYAADHGAKVINLSLGGSNPSSTLENAVNYAISMGVIVVAAAGNNGTEGALYPAAYPDVIAVGSIDPNLQHSSFSNYGSQIDIWAPGREILTTKRDGSYGLVSGTSIAASYVAGGKAVSFALNAELTSDTILFLPTQTVAATETPIVDPTNEVGSQIVGGTLADPGEYPWQVALVNGLSTDFYNSRFCGGTLISSEWVLTAAHCVYYSPASIAVVAGIYNLSNPTAGYQRRLVTETVIHPDFNLSTVDSDIALLKLESPITLGGTGETKTALIPLISPTVGDLVGVNSWVTGWGRTESIFEASNKLREVELPIITNALCNDSNHYNGKITNNMLCAGLEEGGKASCYGDSGGPMIVQSESEWKLAGIVSWGVGCADPHNYDVYTRVSSFVNWINSYINPTLTIRISGNGFGTVTSNPTGINCSASTCTSTFPYNAVVTLTATANSGSTFTGWSVGKGSCPGVGSCTTTMSAANTIVANFTQDSGTIDTTPPSGSWTSPSDRATINSRSVTLGVNAGDNVGGSGVREVRFSAKWNNQWFGVGTDNSAPYSIDWNWCNSGAPNGDVELGMEVWDNANNKWVYSEHSTNIHITKNFNCQPTITGQWHAQYFSDHNWSTPACPRDFNGIGLVGADFYDNWNAGAPCPSMQTDNFSARYTGTFSFGSAGTYWFKFHHDDGAILFVDGVVLQNSPNSGDECPTETLSLEPHTLRIDYQENTGGASVGLEVRNSPCPGPTPPPGPWHAEYFSDQNWSSRQCDQ
jgi:thermitase